MHYAGFDCKRTVPLQSLSGEETLIEVFHHDIRFKRHALKLRIHACVVAEFLQADRRCRYRIEPAE